MSSDAVGPGAVGRGADGGLGTDQGAGGVDEEMRCSGRGCRADAVWALKWNNPRLHTPERRKVWLACEDHRAHLEHFLGARGFHRETVVLDALLPTDG